MTYKYILAAIVCCGLMVVSVSAQTGEVYSLNVVGFQKITAQSNGLTMVSSPFARSPATIDDVVGTQLTATKSQATADQIVIWNPTNQAYDIYWLRNVDMKWYTAGATPVLATNVVIDPEIGFWIRNRATSNATVVVSGDVVDDAAVTNVMLPGLNLVSYSFSTDIDVNQSQLTNGTGNKSQALADQVVLWNAQEQYYEQYWLRSVDRQWYTGGATPVVATGVRVGAGKGFWYRNRATTNFLWVEARPYTL